MLGRSYLTCLITDVGTSATHEFFTIWCRVAHAILSSERFNNHYTNRRSHTVACLPALRACAPPASIPEAIRSSSTPAGEEEELGRRKSEKTEVPRKRCGRINLYSRIQPAETRAPCSNEPRTRRQLRNLQVQWETTPLSNRELGHSNRALELVAAVRSTVEDDNDG